MKRRNMARERVGSVPKILQGKKRVDERQYFFRREKVPEESIDTSWQVTTEGYHRNSEKYTDQLFQEVLHSEGNGKVVKRDSVAGSQKKLHAPSMTIRLVRK